MSQKLEKWRRWLQVIHDDLQQLVMHNDIFWKIGEIVNANPKIQIHSAFYDFIGNSHVAYVVMGIRRHVKVHKDSISFRALLNDIAQNPEALSSSLSDLTLIYCGKAEFGHISRSFSLNSRAIHLKRTKNLPQIGFPSLRSVKSDRLLGSISEVCMLGRWQKVWQIEISTNSPNLVKTTSIPI